MNSSDYLNAVTQAARIGGAILMQMRSTFRAQEKSPKDLVTDADVASQKAIARWLTDLYPDSLFVGEEEGCHGHRPMGDQLCWIVDPLDGTANYVHGMNNFSVSVAAWQSGRVVAGAVFDPTADEMYEACLGKGATLNGSAIRASRCETLEDAMIAVSFPANIQRDSPEIAQFVEVLVRSQSVRRLGSAALNLCYVGGGRLDGYWARSIKAWDVAAGQLVATEAGAILTSVDGEPFELWSPQLTIASTLQLHQLLLGCLGATSQ